MTTIWTQAHLDKLEAAISKGVRSVSYEAGKSVTYHSLAEMLRLRDEMSAAIYGPPVRRSVVAFSRGLD